MASTTMFEKIDYTLLAKQRSVLSQLTDQIPFSREQIDALNGVLNLTYCLAEWAVDNGIATEAEAFPGTDNKE